MLPVLIIEQDATLPGHGLLGQRIAAAGLERASVNAWSDDLATVDPTRYSAVIAMGGNASAFDVENDPWLLGVQDLFERTIAAATPAFGICLGGQVLARTLGADVRIGETGEYGWHEISPLPAAADDPVLSALTQRSGTMQWHRDTFDVPAGAVRLAESTTTANQAFRFGASAWGIQFHPEVEVDVFDTWQANHPGAAAAIGMTLTEMRAAVVRGCDASRAWRSDLFDRFLAVAKGNTR